MKSLIKKLLRLLGWKLIKIRKPPKPNPYGKLDIDILKSINNCSGILHLGAHRGTEAEVYNWFGKKVVWVEALPETYKHLKDNLYFYKNQRAYCALLSDTDNQIKKFNVSNHDGACSSIFEFTEEIKKSEIWTKKNHKMVDRKNLITQTLDTLIYKNNINPKEYNHWILDLQGAELLTLKGSEKSIKSCKSMVIEVSKKKFYKGGVLWTELKNWLLVRGFYQTREPNQDEEDILFLRK